MKVPAIEMEEIYLQFSGEITLWHTVLLSFKVTPATLRRDVKDASFE